MKRLKPTDPFTRARLRLTGWYIIIFSVLIGIFTYLTFQAKESAYVRVYTVVNRYQGADNRLIELDDTYQEFNRRFRQRVLLFDVFTLFAAGFVSWWLAGKTLKPIQDSLEEQKAFAGDVSHGLRTPLTSLRLQIDAYQRTHTKTSPDTTQFLNDCMHEVNHMTRIVEGVLTLTRVHLGNELVKKIEVNSLLLTLVTTIEPLAKEKQQTIHHVPYSQPLFVNANEDQLTQALMIMGENAIKYTPEKGTITVSVEYHSNNVRFKIADTGPGIIKSDRKKIFEKYYRGKATNKSKGTGLGLAIAIKIIKANRGSISVAGNKPHGSVFTIRMPAAI